MSGLLSYGVETIHKCNESAHKNKLPRALVCLKGDTQHLKTDYGLENRGQTEKAYDIIKNGHKVITKL